MRRRKLYGREADALQRVPRREIPVKFTFRKLAREPFAWMIHGRILESNG
jgi:hypothetical protein